VGISTRLATTTLTPIFLTPIFLTHIFLTHIFLPYSSHVPAIGLPAGANRSIILLSGGELDSTGQDDVSGGVPRLVSWPR
jgi:hypothetical protein